MKKISNISFIIVMFSILVLLVSCGKKDTETNGVTEINAGSISVEVGATDNNSNSITVQSGKKESNKLATKFASGEIGNLKCKIKTTQEGGDIDQTVYISGMKMKMETTVTYAGKTNNTHMLVDGDNSYTWGGGTFIKMKIDTDLVEDGEEAEMEEEVESDDVKNYNKASIEPYLEQIPYNECSKWEVDETVFELPKNEFKDVSEGFNLDMSETIISEGYEDIENNPYENMGDIEGLKDMIPDDLQNHEYVEPMEDKFPSNSGL